MPRAAKESENEGEARSVRRTRATVAQSVLDSPRRSSRLKATIATVGGSSPESVNDDASNRPTTRGTRSRTTTMESGPLELPRTLRPRKTSASSSDVSENAGTESNPATPVKRSTKKSLTAAPSIGTPKSNPRGGSARRTRAGSETRSPAVPVRTTRRTRASSAEPEPVGELLNLRGSVPAPSTPIKGRQRASALPSEPAVAEEAEETKSAFPDVSKIPEMESKRKNAAEKSTETSQTSPAPIHRAKSPSENASQAESSIATITDDGASSADKSITEITEIAIGIATSDAVEEFAATNSPPSVSKKSSKRKSAERSKELGLKIEELLNKSTEEQNGRSPGNKENEKDNVVAGTTSKRNSDFAVSSASVGEIAVEKARSKLNLFLDEWKTSSPSSSLENSLKIDEDSTTDPERLVVAEEEVEGSPEGGGNRRKCVIVKESFVRLNKMAVSASPEAGQENDTRAEETPESSEKMDDSDELVLRVAEEEEAKDSSREEETRVADDSGDAKDTDLICRENEEDVAEDRRCDEVREMEVDDAPEKNPTDGELGESFDSKRESREEAVDVETTSRVGRDDASETEAVENVGESSSTSVARRSGCEEAREGAESLKRRSGSKATARRDSTDATNPTDSSTKSERVVTPADRVPLPRKSVNSPTKASPTNEESAVPVSEYSERRDSSIAEESVILMSQSWEIALDKDRNARPASNEPSGTKKSSIVADSSAVGQVASDEREELAKEREEPRRGKEDVDVNSSDYDLNIAELFQDIPADEWNWKKLERDEKNSAGGNSINSLSTEKLHDSEPECDLELNARRGEKDDEPEDGVVRGDVAASKKKDRAEEDEPMDIEDDSDIEVVPSDARKSSARKSSVERSKIADETSTGTNVVMRISGFDEISGDAKASRKSVEGRKSLVDSSRKIEEGSADVSGSFSRKSSEKKLQKTEGGKDRSFIDSSGLKGKCVVEESGEDFEDENDDSIVQLFSKKKASKKSIDLADRKRRSIVDEDNQNSGSEKGNSRRESLKKRKSLNKSTDSTNERKRESIVDEDVGSSNMSLNTRKSLNKSIESNNARKQLMVDDDSDDINDGEIDPTTESLGVRKSMNKSVDSKSRERETIVDTDTEQSESEEVDESIDLKSRKRLSIADEDAEKTGSQRESSKKRRSLNKPSKFTDGRKESLSDEDKEEADLARESTKSKDITNTSKRSLDKSNTPRNINLTFSERKKKKVDYKDGGTSATEDEEMDFDDEERAILEKLSDAVNAFCGKSSKIKEYSKPDSSTEESSDNDDDEDRLKVSKESELDENYSTLVSVGSATKEDSSDDLDSSHGQTLPRLFFDVPSSDDDEDNDGDNSSKSIDSDLAKEYNLAGDSDPKFSDDDVPADECRASESEYSDEEDNGADLADFVVDNDEVESSEEMEITSENDEETSPQSGKKAYRRIVANSSSSENEDKDEADLEEEAKYSPAASPKNREAPAYSEVFVAGVDESMKKRLKLRLSGNSSLASASSTPKVESRSKSETPRSDDTKSSSRNVTPTTSEVTPRTSIRESDESGKKKRSARKSLDPKTQDEREASFGELDTSKKKTPKDSSPKEFTTVWTTVTKSRKSMLTPNSETPVTKFLKKQKLNESLPTMKANEKMSKSRRSMLEDLKDRFPAIVGNKEANQRAEVDGAEAEGEPEEELEEEPEEEPEEVAEVPDVKASKKLSRRQKRALKKAASSSMEEKQSDQSEEQIDEAEEEPRNEDVDAETTDGNERKKKKKKRSSLPKPEEDTAEEIVPENVEEVVDASEESKKRKKQKSRKSKEISETSTLDAKKAKKSLGRKSEEANDSATDKRSKELEDDSDEAPEVVGFSAARDEALRMMKSASDSAKAEKETRKRKRREKLDRIQCEKEAKLQKTKQKEGAEARLSKGVKRLSDEIIGNLSDVAERPRKKQKLVTKGEKPSRTMFSPSGPSRTSVHVEDCFIPLSSSGGTTQFSVVGLQKLQKQTKKSNIATSFKVKMLSRNSRQPVSAYLMYRRKQEAMGRNKYSG